MKLDYILGAIVATVVLGIMGTLDRQDQEAAARHKDETIAAAKIEFKRQQQWDALLQESERLTFPLAAYKK